MPTKQNKGFTLLEIVLVIAAIGILASIVLVAINPNRQIEAARNAKRRSDINTIQKAIQQYSIDNNGQYPAGIETGAKAICRGGTPVGCIDLSILVPNYLASIPEPDSNYYYVRRSNNNIEVRHPRDEIWNIGGNPSLDLDFASNKSLIDSVSGNNLINFTRNSIGTYVGEDGLIKTAGINEPRFDHDPVTGESLGLLVEESRRNYAVYSTYNTTPTSGGPAWYMATSQQLGLSIETGLLAPDGSNTAVRFISEGTNYAYARISFPNLPTTPTGIQYTFSFYAKLNEIPSSNSAYNVDIGDEGGVNYYSQLKLGEWVRISRTVNKTDSSLYKQFADFINGGVVEWDLTVWGLQVEQGSFSTSYIPTSGSPVTRNSDNVIISGTNFSNWYAQSGYTIFTNHIAPPVTQNGPYPRVFNITTTASGDSNRLNHYHTPLVAGGYKVGASVVENNTIGHVDLNTTFSQGLVAKMASRFAEDNSAVSLNGAVVGNDNNSSINSVARDILTIGSAINQQYLNSTISRFTYYPYSITNNQLMNLTK